MNRRILSVVLLLLLPTATLGAQAGVATLHRAAERGDATAQNDLGMLYALGKGVPLNAQTAVKWFRKAAEQGDAEAQYNLSLMYGRGQGVAQDDQEAMRWARKAAEQGYAKAQALLGVMYERGDGIPRAYPEAAKWYRKGADQGEPMSQLRLALLLEQGQGLPQDSVQALVWLYLALSQGNADARPHIDRIVTRLSTDQIATVQDKVRYWRATDASSPARTASSTKGSPSQEAATPPPATVTQTAADSEKADDSQTKAVLLPESSPSQEATATPPAMIAQPASLPEKAEPDMLELLITTSIASTPAPEPAPSPPAVAVQSKEIAPAPVHEPASSPPAVAKQKKRESPLRASRLAKTAPIEPAPVATEKSPPAEEHPAAAGELSRLLGEVTLYLQQARHPKSPPPPEGKEALRKLRQAERLDPKNSSVAQALRLYSRRHLACTGVFISKEVADEEVRRIQAVGVPVFQQPMIVQGKPMLRTCIGLFPTAEETEQQVRHLRTALGIKEAILRVYEDPDFPELAGD
ncbi:MAG: hypothetical protein H7836_11135 [Magnetococcus sp. YQC-3]